MGAGVLRLQELRWLSCHLGSGLATADFSLDLSAPGPAPSCGVAWVSPGCSPGEWITEYCPGPVCTEPPRIPVALCGGHMARVSHRGTHCRPARVHGQWAPGLPAHTPGPLGRLWGAGLSPFLGLVTQRLATSAVPPAWYAHRQCPPAWLAAPGCVLTTVSTNPRGSTPGVPVRLSAAGPNLSPDLPPGCDVEWAGWDVCLFGLGSVVKRQLRVQGFFCPDCWQASMGTLLASRV